jgi:hypothetical protein
MLGPGVCRLAAGGGSHELIGETPEWAFWAILGLLALMMLLPTIKR